MPLESGDQLGPYKIQALLGVGGFGEVYRGRDTRLGREVALKVISPRLVGDSILRQRFELEARAASALNHPSIVTVYDVGESNGMSWIAMEWDRGPNPPPCPGRRSAPHSRSLVDRPANRRGTGSRACQRHRPPRSQTRERHACEGRTRQNSRFWTGAAKLRRHAGSVVSRDSRQPCGYSDVRGRDPRHRRLHVSRAGVRAHRRRPIRPVCLRTAALRDAGGTPCVRTGRQRSRPSQPSSEKIPRRCLRCAPGSQSRCTQSSLDVLPSCRTIDSHRRAISRRRWNLWVQVRRLKRLHPRRPSSVTREVHLRQDQPSALIGRRPIVLSIVSAVLLLALGMVGWNALKSPSTAIDSLAVLPFENVGKHPDAEYLSDGLTETLINQMSGVPSLKVMARGTVFRFQGSGSAGGRAQARRRRCSRRHRRETRRAARRPRGAHRNRHRQTSRGQIIRIH